MTRSTPPSARRRILLIDDDAISMEVLAILLEQDRHEVLRATDGGAALDLLLTTGSSAFPDVLLVDMQMPGISGYEVARQVCAMAGPKPLLLAMSATGIGIEQLQGFDGFLLKPLDMGDLRRALKAGKRRQGPRGTRERGQRIVNTQTTDTQTTASAPETADALDHGVLRKLEKAMSASALGELYEACIADTRSRAAAVRKQVLAGDLLAVPRVAHQIKGAASMVGAARIVKLAVSLELGSCKEEDTLRLLDDLLISCDELERILLAGKR